MKPGARKPGRTVAILAMAAGIVLIMLELENHRRQKEVAWFWVGIAAFAIVLAVVHLIARQSGK